MNSVINRNRKALVTQLYELLNRYDFATAATMVVVSRNTQDYLKHWQDVKRTFPDVRLEPLDIIVEGDWIVVHSLFSGTHRGTAKLAHHGGLLVDAKPTGRTVSVAQMHVYQVLAGKLIELYAVRDDLSLYQQLRLLPNVSEDRPEPKLELNYSPTHALNNF
jgi:predicted ester cyclase